MRTLTQRELNRALLARQLLLDRGRMPLPRALEAVGGIQAQYAPSMYVGLWSRLEGFERQALNDALVDRTVVQATLMRVTIHLVSREDFWPFALATRDVRRALWLRTRPEKTSANAMAGAARTVRRQLSGGNALRRAELDALVGKDRALGAGLWVDLVRAPPSGTWERRRADLFALAEEWIGPPPDVAGRDAAEHLVRRYLTGFGPASRKDVAELHRLRPATARPGPRAAGSAPLRRRGRRGAARRPRRPAPRPGDAGAAARSSGPGTRRCSPTRGAPACCRRSTGRGSSTRRRRSRFRRS